MKGVDRAAWAEFRAQVELERRTTGEVLTDAIDVYVEYVKKAEKDTA